MFALVDCNSCYASCEQIFRPDLRGKPVVVLTNNDGCIVARTKEAKALDIPDLIPYFKIKDVLAKQHVHVFSSNYELYGDISKRVMFLLKDYGRDIEVYSIDEAFLDVTGCEDFYAHGWEIKQACWKEQRMPVSVGIAKTKTLSKLANHIAKKSEKLNGVCVIDDVEKWSRFFSRISVKKVWGIGSRLSKRLGDYSIYTVQDLRAQPPKRLRKDFGVNIERIVRELNGEPCITLNPIDVSKKEIICSRSFSKKTTSKHELKEALANYAMRACQKLREQKSLTRRVHIMLQTSRFNPPFYFCDKGVNLSYPTNDSRVVIKAALDVFETIFKPGFSYAKAGVMVMDLVEEDFLQHDFFQAGQHQKAFGVMETLDAVNARYGVGSLFLGRQGMAREWAMARSFKSPAYTTRLSDVPIIKVK